MTIRVKSDEQYINTLLGINKELGDFAREMRASDGVWRA